MSARYLAALLMLVGLWAPFQARAELTQVDDTIVSFRGGFFPTSLPRHKPSPVKVHIASDVKSTLPAASAPHLKRVTLAINNGGGQLSSRGLGTCRKRAIQPASFEEARRMCGNALVGSGNIVLQFRYPEQVPFQTKVRVLYFNAPRYHGQTRIFAQAYSSILPAAFIVPTVLSRQKGIFGTTVKSTVPRGIVPFTSFKHFDMTLERTYFFQGKRRSFLSAACSAPAGFSGAIFPLARITYGFDTGRTVTTTIVRGCLVRE